MTGGIRENEPVAGDAADRVVPGRQYQRLKPFTDCHVPTVPRRLQKG